MNTQTPTTPLMICNFVVADPEADYTSEGSIYASSRDYGFDFNEAELAEELLAPLPASLADQPVPEVKGDEFGQSFHYFFS